MTSSQSTERAGATNQPSRGRILRTADEPVIDRARGVKTQPLVMSERGSQTLTTGLSTFQSGSIIPLHTHNVEEAITILEGEAIAIIDGQEFPWSVRHTFVPPGVPPIRNESALSCASVDLWRHRRHAHVRRQRRNVRTSPPKHPRRY